MLALKPNEQIQEIDHERLNFIVEGVLTEITLHLIKIKNSAITHIAFNVLKEIGLQLIEDFDDNGNELDLLLQERIGLIWKEMCVCEVDIRQVFISPNGGIHSKLNNVIFLVWDDVNEKIELLGVLLQRTFWFNKVFSINDFFDNKRPQIVFHCLFYSISFLSYLIFRLHEIKCIKASRGKGYIEAACRHIACEGKLLDSNAISKWITRINNNPEKYTLIIRVVDEFIEKLCAKDIK